MKEQKNVVWGTKCSCGEECFILENKCHPWMDKDFSVTMICPSCKSEVIIDQANASSYYNERIYHYYKHVIGKVIDLGCGGGFISAYLLENEKVDYIYALDVDDSVKDYINALNPGRMNFIQTDIKDLSQHFEKNSVDYLVHRDVFMFIENTNQYFDDITRIVSKGIVHMGWFLEGNERMKNQLRPDEIKKELELRGWEVALEYLNWYKYGYVITAHKKENYD